MSIRRCCWEVTTEVSRSMHAIERNFRTSDYLQRVHHDIRPSHSSAENENETDFCNAVCTSVYPSVRPRKRTYSTIMTSSAVVAKLLDYCLLQRTLISDVNILQTGAMKTSLTFVSWKSPFWRGTVASCSPDRVMSAREVLYVVRHRWPVEAEHSMFHPMRVQR